jgi:hypothetical protein
MPVSLMLSGPMKDLGGGFMIRRLLPAAAWPAAAVATPTGYNGSNESRDARTVYAAEQKWQCPCRIVRMEFLTLAQVIR